MDINTINRIVWWIPFKQLRNDVRKYLMRSSKMHDINDRYFIGYIQNDIEKSRNELLYKYKKLINGLDNESTETVSNIVSALSRNNMYFTDNEVSIKEDLRKKHNNKNK